MIPVLYENNETNFTGNGICRLYDTISCGVVEERNGIYEVELQFPTVGENFKEIRVGRVISVYHDATKTTQPFDIISASRPIDGIVTFRGVHISYRLGKVVVSGTNINSVGAAMDLLALGIPANDFTFTPKFASVGKLISADGIPKSVRSMLGGEEGSILDTYGGELEFDKYDVILHEQRGSYSGFSVRYGVNLVGFNETIDIEDSYTSLIPYWSGIDEYDHQQIVIGDLCTTTKRTPTGRVEAIALDLSSEFETMPSQNQLEQAGDRYLRRKQPYIPTDNIQINVADLESSGEFQNYESILDCVLCDFVAVYFPAYQIEGTFEVVRLEYDVLSERYTKIELGQLSTTLSEALGISK